MGWSFRKSVNVGPLRINLSKSGLGLSGGTKGFRISSGPRGTYLRAGRGGLYYTRKLGNAGHSLSTGHLAGWTTILGIAVIVAGYFLTH